MIDYCDRQWWWFVKQLTINFFRCYGHLFALKSPMVAENIMKKELPLGKLDHKFLQKLICKLPRADKSVLIPPGIGLDAAGVKIGNRLVAITTDPITLASDEIGTYSVAININDVACLGCKPHWYLANLLLPAGTTATTVKKIWHNLASELKRYDIQAIGGHVEVTSTVNNPIIVGTMIGEAITKHFLTPKNACAGDKILLWQNIAIEGTALLAKEHSKYLQRFISIKKINAMQNLLHNPGICIWPFAQKIIPQKGIIALHDITEGGIATALHELADASGCGLKINGAHIIIRKETQELATILHFNPLGLLASGSLLIIVQKNTVNNILNTFPQNKLTVIGELTNAKERTIYYGIKKQKLPRFDTDEITKINLNK